MSIVTGQWREEIERLEALQDRECSCVPTIESQIKTEEARVDAAILSDAHLCLKYCALSFVSKKSNVQAFYVRMRIAGQSHSMAEMLALRAFPGISGTDSQFMAGTHCQDGVIDQVRYQYAHDQGVDTNGRRYLSGLARFPNDPEAWVSGRDDVLRVCRDRGWNCTGMVEHSAPEFEPEADIPIGQDIVNQHVSSCLAAYDEGEVTPQLIGDITEHVTRELTGEIDLSPDLKVAPYDNPFDRPGLSD